MVFICSFASLSSLEMTMAALAWFQRRVTVFLSPILMKGDKHTALFPLKLLIGNFPGPTLTS